MDSRHNHRVLYMLAGLMLGLLILHPYAMLVSRVATPAKSDAAILLKNDFFNREMALMAMGFGLLGGVIGVLIVALRERKKRLFIARLEQEKREIALRTIHDLMVTLSHYLLNANMIIGGKVRRCRKLAAERDLLDNLDVIEEQGRKIDAVLSVLRDLVEINTSHYTSDGLVNMIDIAGELQERMKPCDNNREISAEDTPAHPLTH